MIYLDMAALYAGYICIALGLVSVVALSLIGTAMLINRAIWHVINTCGGMKNLRLFRDWYLNHHKLEGEQ